MTGSIIANSIKNANDLTKAFNVFFDLRGKINKVIEIIKEYNQEDDNFKLSKEFTAMIKLLSELYNSRRAQLLAESEIIYSNY